MSTYLDESRLPYPFCPGCGHGLILNHLNAALSRLALDPRRVVIVTDIGCQGLSDKFFATNALHGLHGRSVTYASGIKLVNPDLKVIVLIGDGGCGIGGHHLLNAARRNIGVTVLVFNNLNYGMTGGEHSVTTPTGAVTATTPYGNLERPLDICATVAANGATFVARTTAFDKSLPDLIAEAVQNEGFSLIDIWELCTAHFVPNNRFSRKALEETMARLDFPSGVLHREERPEYSRAYRQATASWRGQEPFPPQVLTPRYAAALDEPRTIVLAGAAGKRIGTAATALARGAVLSGLWATQRGDYPVTVRSGYSISEVILSPQEIRYTGITKPDIMLILFPEGLARVRATVETLDERSTLYVNTALLPLDVTTRARIVPLAFKDTGQKKERWAMMAVAAMLQDTALYPPEAFREAVAMRKKSAEADLAALDAAPGVLSPPVTAP